MKCSTLMRGQIKKWETGLDRNGKLLPQGEPALYAYLCPRKVWTVGWGATGKGITRSTVITRQQAERLFDAHIAIFEAGVLRAIKGGAETSQGQFDALVSFAYNVGLDEDADTKAEGLGDSTLLKYHRAGRYREAADEFPKWTSGGLAGLISRRKIERDYYLR